MASSEPQDPGMALAGTETPIVIRVTPILTNASRTSLSFVG